MAYGAISAPTPTVELPTLSYTLPDGRRLTCFPVSRSTVPEGAAEHLLKIFSVELASGQSYPQEHPSDLPTFLSYFFAATCILGLISESTDTNTTDRPAIEDGTRTTTSIEQVRAGRGWEECLVGCYYIKPNYPGRSSHNCNAGFLIAHNTRGLKVGFTLGKSYLIYAPMLANKASLAIWDRLGFTRVGEIPGAGRLITGKTADGEDVEEYVDAVIVWKSFV